MRIINSRRLVTVLAFLLIASVLLLVFRKSNVNNIHNDPAQSPSSPLSQPPSLATIPTAIHQTYKTATLADWAKEEGKNNRTLWFLSWQQKNPSYSHTVLNDKAADEFIAANFDKETQTAWAKMPLPVLKADLLRYAMLYIHGGIYSDSDTECLQPIDSWYGPYESASFIASVEWYKDSHNFDVPMYKKTQLVQWTFGASPRHPALLATINDIVQKVSFASIAYLSSKKNVEAIGGPQVLTRHVLEYMKSHGDDLDSLQKADDDKGRMYFKKSRVLLLPMFSFMAQLAPERLDPVIAAKKKSQESTLFVNHHFAGTYLDNGWKN
ncbi:membrane-bound alpha-1,6- mannosyltransferase Initiation-specific [Rhizoclosmatium hyalinum]|nr:membrane-bound alpha-1,6- mannosyltransferase Initiation-specific [Rhizoclosmatium hyalinum]